MKLLGTLAATLLLLVASLAIADGDKKGQKDDKEGKDRPFAKGSKDQGRGGRPDIGWPRRDSNNSGFGDLSDEEKKKVREALQLVWSNPEVVAARKELHEASEHYRETMRTALSGVDPEIQEILKKMMMSPRGGNGPRDNWGDPNQPGFARAALKRISKEISDRMKPDIREAFLPVHEEAITSEKVQNAIKAIENEKDVRKKMERARKLREVYRTTLESLDPTLKEYFGRFQGGGLRPPASPSGERRERPQERPGPPRPDRPEPEDGS